MRGLCFHDRFLIIDRCLAEELGSPAVCIRQDGIAQGADSRAGEVARVFNDSDNDN